MTLEELAKEVLGDDVIAPMDCLETYDDEVLTDQRDFSLKRILNALRKLEADTEKRVQEELKTHALFIAKSYEDEKQAEQCVELPSDEEMINALNPTNGGERVILRAAHIWLRANVKMRTVDDVRAEQKHIIDQLNEALSEEEARAQVLVDTLEEIAKRPDLPNPERDADWETCMKFSSHEAREALKAYGEGK